MTSTQPRTKAGKAYLDSWNAQVGWLESGDKAPATTERTYRDEAERAIAAIEEEAVSEYREALDRLVTVIEMFAPELVSDVAVQEIRSLLDRSGVTG